MKTKIFSLIAAALVCFSAHADDIWGKGRYTNISYVFAQTGTDFSPVDKGKYGVALTKGTTYLFPKEAFAGYVKVGFDVNWLDVTFARYNSGVEGDWDSALPGQNLGSNEGGIFDVDKFLNLGRYGLQIGAFGIGPNVTVAPFNTFDNAARELKASIYFHYQPTVGAYLVSEDGDIDASFAYCNMFQLGGKITWKFIGLGIEGHWGSGNFKQIGGNFDDWGGFFGESSSSKVKRKFANTRLYVSFIF